MYLDYYGFKKEPFNITPDSSFLFLSKRHREALASLLYGIEQRKGFIALTGEIGCGKTTICRALLGKLDRERVHLALILNPQLSDTELLQAINSEFGLPAQSASKRELLDELNQYLLEQYKHDNIVVLVIDEAQQLSPEALEQVRLLSNLETETAKLIQIALVGQPELAELLDLPELEQLNQRITVRTHIEPLNIEEVTEYIAHRLALCEPKFEIRFTKKAVRKVFEYSAGVPRRVNVICDRSLLVTYVREEKEVVEDNVLKAIEELGGMPKRHKKRKSIAADDDDAPPPTKHLHSPAEPAAAATRERSSNLWPVGLALLAGLIAVAYAVTTLRDDARPGIDVVAAAPPARPAETPPVQEPEEPTPAAEETPAPEPLPTEPEPEPIEEIAEAEPEASELIPGMDVTPTPVEVAQATTEPPPTTPPATPVPETPVPTASATPVPTTPLPINPAVPPREITDAAPPPVSEPDEETTESLALRELAEETTPVEVVILAPSPAPVDQLDETTDDTLDLAKRPPTATPVPEPPPIGVVPPTPTREALITALMNTPTPTPEPPKPWHYDADGVVRVMRDDVTYPAAVLTWLSQTTKERLPEPELELLRGMQPDQLAALKLTEGRPPLHLREARFPSDVYTIPPTRLPALVQVDNRAPSFGPWAVLVSVENETATLHDPRAGRLQMPLDLLDEHITSLVVPFFDRADITGIKPFERGDRVVALQNRLKELGLYMLEPSGVYDPFTESVVMRYREKALLPGDAVIDPLLAYHLLKETESTP